MLFWGIVSAIGLATFNLAALPLQIHYPTTQIVGPSMFASGILLAILTRPSINTIYWDIYAGLGLLFCIFFGTFLPFVFYMKGHKRAGPDLASIFGLAEPVFSTLIAIFIYGLIFKPLDYIGMGLIFGSIFILTIRSEVKT